MNNKSKKSSFLKNLLATASIASVIVGGSNAAFADALTRVTNNDNTFVDALAATHTWHDVGGTDADGPIDGQSIKFGGNSHVVNVNAVRKIQAINVNGKTDAVVMITADLTVGSIVDTSVNNLVDFIFGPSAVCTLTLNGTPTTIAGGHDFTVAANTYTALGKVNFVADGDTLNIKPTTLGDIDFPNFEVLTGANTTLNIDNRGFTVKFGRSEVATARTINIFDGNTVEFNSRILHLQKLAGDKINFGDTGKGTLLLSSKNAASADFKVMNGSLVGAKDEEGIIHFNTTAADGTLSHVVAGSAVVGTRKDLRAKKFIVTTGAGNNATIEGGVYTKELELNGGGETTFAGKIDVGDQGVTNIKSATMINLKGDSNLGKTDFQNKASTITMGNDTTLEGDFHANVVGGSAVRNGTIVFQGNGTLKGTGNNLLVIRNDGAGILKLSGRHTVTELQGTKVDVHFTFDKDYKLTGDINQTVGAGVPGDGFASDLTFDGNAEITGNIGAAGVGAVGNITIPKDSTVIVGGTTIMANSIFNKVDGGTLKLNNKADVTIKFTISANGGGTIDATAMDTGKTLNIVGTIAMDPTVDNSKPLDKLLLKGQNPNFDLAAAANKWVNIAGIDFGGEVSTVKMNVVDAKYAFGALTNAEESTFEVSQNVSLYNTTTSQDGWLKAINFKADDKTLTLNKGNDITAKSITAFGGAKVGNLVFAGNATLKGAIGESGSEFNELKVNAGVKAITSGPGFFSGNIQLGDESTLVVDSNYTAKAVVGDVPDKGRLKFVNAAGVGTGVKFTTADANAAINNGIATLELHGGDVALEGNGIKFSNIKFTSATAASLTLAPQMKLDGINVVSTFSTAGGSSKDPRPTVVLSAIDHTIDKANHIGGIDKDHLVNLQFAGDNILNVSTPSFFAGVTTKTDNQGTVNFNNAGFNQVYGLGSEGRNLKAATFEVNTENFGDTYVNNGIMNDNVVYKAGGIVFGRLQVGNANGGSVAEFKDKVILTAAMTSKGANNKINFTNDAVIYYAKLGEENARFKAITFNGNKKVGLKNAAMYAEIVDFGSEDIIIIGDNIISGTSRINSEINLNSGKLIFQDNQNNVVSTWGPKTSITTTLTADGKLGSIEVNTPIEMAASVPVNAIIVKDEAQLGADQEYNLITNNKNLRLVNNAQFGPLTGVTTDQAYAKWTVQTRDNKDVYLLRSNGAATIAPIDVAAVGGDEIDKENAAKLGREALGPMTYIGLFKDQKERGAALQQLVNIENRLVSEAIDHANVGIANLVGARLAQVDQQKPVGSGSDDVAGESMGAWAMPYYNQAVQKGEGSVVGYKTKSAGGVLGFDALASENLTIGAAVSIVRTDMKYKDYKFGEKTNINTVMLSIYGSQQLDKDFFVQGFVSFGSNKIKNSDPRKVPTSRNASGQQIAKASYDSLSYGGQVLFGYNAKVSDSVSLTPMAGIRYTGSSDEGYKETGTDNVNKVVGKKTNNKVEAVLGTRFVVSVDTSGITVMPEAHAFVSQKLVGSSGKVNAKLDGMTSSFATRSDKAEKTFNLGLGVTAKAGNMEYGAGYDAYLASKYVGHQGTLKVRVNF